MEVGRVETLADGASPRPATDTSGAASGSSGVDTTEASASLQVAVGSHRAGAANAEPTEPVASILRELTTSVEIKAEIQCTLCHEVLWKPVTTPCGHSFCRVCLVEYLLSKEVEDTQCPICRGLVLHSSLKNSTPDGAAPIFSINVTLWNLVQLLVPDLRVRDPAGEEADYALKYDQYDAKWRIAALQESATRGRRRRQQAQDEIESSDEELDDGRESSDHEDALNERVREQYPELRQETTVDGDLEVSRNVVLDRDDANEDGYEGMRVSLAIMEFPSLLRPVNEHQECSIAVLKCEEDEDMDGGIPFFTSDDGEDDGFIIPSYYNEIRLRVMDDEGNTVLERVRGSTQGIANFPGLRLDVPAGMYNFQFSDDYYGLNLNVRTELRNIQNEDDGSAADLLEARMSRRPRNLLLDQAGERSRSRRHRGSDEDEESGEGYSDSDDSFIVDDDDGIVEDNYGADFSGSEESEAEWSQANSDDEEDLQERFARSESAIRLHSRRDRHNMSFSDENHRNHDGSSRSDLEGASADGGAESEPDEEDIPSSVSSNRSTKRTRIIDDDDESEEDDNAHDRTDSPTLQPGQRNGFKRARAILDSEDDMEDFNPSPHGFTSHKRLRQVTSRLFQDDAEEGEWDGDANQEIEGAEPRSRWIGSDPYSTGDQNQRDSDFGLDDDVRSRSGDDLGDGEEFGNNGIQ